MSLDNFDRCQDTSQLSKLKDTVEAIPKRGECYDRSGPCILLTRSNLICLTLKLLFKWRRNIAITEFSFFEVFSHFSLEHCILWSLSIWNCYSPPSLFISLRLVHCGFPEGWHVQQCQRPVQDQVCGRGVHRDPLRPEGVSRSTRICRELSQRQRNRQEG